MREIVIAGNWKMNTTPFEGAMLARKVAELLSAGNGATVVTVVVCPPATHLAMAQAGIASVTTESGVKVELGAQNAHWEHKGAFTGEISASMLKFIGCRWVIIGHSERRQWFGETDETANKRLLRVIRNGLRPIFCIGETLEEREADRAFEVIERQLKIGLDGVENIGRGGLVIAYEPVWAIGTGHTATPEQAQEAHQFIRSQLSEQFSEEAAAATVIQYGGSMTPDNAGQLMACPDVDGGLVGGASLKADSFSAIVKAAAEAKGRG